MYEWLSWFGAPGKAGFNKAVNKLFASLHSWINEVCGILIFFNSWTNILSRANIIKTEKMFFLFL